MVADDWKDQTKRLQRFADSLSDNWVLPHQLPFLGGQTAWLQDDRIRNRNLPDVVDHARAPECGEHILWKAEVLSQRGGILRQTLTMAVRVGIFAFDTPCKREQDRLCPLELIRSLFQFQEGTHAGQEFGAVDRRLRKSSAPTRIPSIRSCLSESAVTKMTG